MQQNQNEKAFTERYKKLNRAQKRAVDVVLGPVLVVAGPGSGKTEILSLRVANILKKTDAAPSNILCLTFTDSAAVNMRARLAEIIGADAYKVAIHTFHSFGLEVINRNPEFFYNGAHFIPADELTKIKIIEEILTGLPHDNPLRSEHPEQGFVYASAIIDAISHIKRAGLTPDEFRAILHHNLKEQEYLNPLLAEVFDKRISKATIGEAEKLLAMIENHRTDPPPVPPFGSWLAVVAQTLKRALEKAKELDKPTPLSTWKSDYTKKDEEGRRVHRDYYYHKKILVLADIYEKYRETMHRLAFYDFDDMLLETIIALEGHETLRFALQEQFQFILVDEFQDTNDAQVRILKLLSDAPVHEGRPNVMAVGDDDQAIYKFQGADISNILYFKDMYHEPEIITMTENYRSTQLILDIAHHIIKEGEERLETTIPWLEKKLTAANPHITEGDIVHKIFPTHLNELAFIASEIKRRIADGVPPEEIAVIGRHHKELARTAAYLAAENIPLRYERQENVLEEPHIKQIITILTFIATLSQKRIGEADYLLPEILSYPFWGIPRREVWKLSVEANRERKENGGEWMGAMRKSDNRQIRDIAAFFDELSAIAHTEPLEVVIDNVIGSHTQLVADSEDDDGTLDATEQRGSEKSGFVSPFRSFYFGKESFEKNPARYLSFLSGLRTFIHAIREYKNGEHLTVFDLVEFVALSEKNKISLPDTGPFAGVRSAVSLLTAHKAKGLEFETVFVLSCQDDVWIPSGHPNKLPFPENLKITPAGDTLDDQRKLFYVAMTRAKRNLYLTAYTHKDDGKESLKVRFLNIRDTVPSHIANILDAENVALGEDMEVIKILEKGMLPNDIFPLGKDERALLAALVEDYRMPVTHLNNFIDVSAGGPQTFLEQNLLRFPQSMSPSGAYGTAIHKTIELIYLSLKKYGELPDIKDIIAWFERELGMKRLSDTDYELLRKRGETALIRYYEAKKQSFSPTHMIEVDFNHQGVVVGEAALTGKIDKLEVYGGAVVVTDFKTGKATKRWQGRDNYEKIKLHKYKNQLIFYKLLVEHSRDFHTHTVKEGVIEFVEPAEAGGVVHLPLTITDEDTERMKRLVDAVYKKIAALDFPDIGKYEPTLAGVRSFEDDLIEGKV